MSEASTDSEFESDYESQFTADPARLIEGGSATMESGPAHGLEPIDEGVASSGSDSDELEVVPTLDENSSSANNEEVSEWRQEAKDGAPTTRSRGLSSADTPTMAGYLAKQGGGTRWFGRHSWKVGRVLDAVVRCSSPHNN